MAAIYHQENMIELQRFVIVDPLTNDYLTEYINGLKWSDNTDDIQSEAIFNTIAKAKRVVKIVVDKYIPWDDEDFLSLEIHRIIIKESITDIKEDK